MTLDQIRIFLKVAELLNMTRAAEALHLSQPAVSAAISALENRYGTRLFHRVGRHLELSETGAAFLPQAQVLQQQISNTAQILEELAGLRRGAIHIFASQTLASYWLPSRMARFAAICPEITLELSVGNTAQTVEAVTEGRAALGFLEGAFDTPGLCQTVLDEDRLGLYASPSHPLVGQQVTVADLRENHWVMREPGSGTRDHFAHCLPAHGLSLDDLTIRLSLPSNGAVLSAAAAGAWIGVVSCLAAQARVQAGSVATLDFPLPPRHFSMISHCERPLSRAARAFVDMLQAHRKEP